MKRCKKLMTFITVILVFAMTFTSVSIPANAATVRNVTVKNLPSDTLTLKAGKTFTLKTNVAAGSLKFSSGNRRVVTVTSGGKLKAVKNGKANITVSLKTNARVKKVIKVTVGNPVTRVSLNKTKLDLAKGRSASLRARVSASNASNKKIIWKSSNKKVVSVSSTGKVRAVSGGSAVITAVAADGSGKKAVCKVAVKASISSIRFKKNSGIMYSGSRAQLSPVVAPADATNKRFTWKSSNEKAVLVSQTGTVIALDEGTAVITAVTTDGTAKKASYKITVKKPVTIAAFKVSDAQTASVTLSAAQKLSASNFKVMTSTVVNGKFNINVPYESVTTKDNKTYTIKFKKDTIEADDIRLRVCVSGLAGTGTGQAETYYSQGKYNTIYYVSYSEQQNSNFTQDQYLNLSPKGSCNVTVSGLPAGVSWERDSDSENYIIFSGRPTKVGTVVSTLVAEDELGNVAKTIITWNIYNASVIVANYEPSYYLIGTAKDSSVYIENYISSVAGGSGSYDYTIIGNNFGLEQSGSYIYGTLAKAGTYNIKVKITDRYNSAISTTVTCPITVVQGITVSGVIKDKSGQGIPNADVSFYNRGRSGTFAGMTRYAEADEKGAYSVTLIPGTYDVRIEIPSVNYESYLQSQKIEKSGSRYDYKTTVKKIKVVSLNSRYSVNKIGIWRDEDGNNYGSGDVVYLTPGTYSLTASGSGMKGSINATVKDNTTSVNATVEDTTVYIGNSSSVDAEKNEYYRFVPDKTATYYFYSVSQEDSDPYGHLYDANFNEIESNDDDDFYLERGISDNHYDFYMTHECIAGETYYISVSREGSMVYITTTAPGNSDDIDI